MERNDDSAPSTAQSSREANTTRNLWHKTKDFIMRKCGIYYVVRSFTRYTGSVSPAVNIHSKKVQATGPDDTNVRRLNDYCRRVHQCSPTFWANYDGRDWSFIVQVNGIIRGEGTHACKSKARQVAAGNALEGFELDYIDYGAQDGLRG